MLSYFFDKNKKLYHLFNKYQFIEKNNIKYNWKNIYDFLVKKYKWNIEKINEAYNKLDIFFNKYKIQTKIFNFIYWKLNDKEYIEKLFKEFFHENKEFTPRWQIKYWNLIRFLNLENILKIWIEWSTSQYNFFNELLKWNILHRVFILFNNFNKENTEKWALKDTYTFIRTQLKRWSILNPYFISTILNKYKWKNLLSLVHSWQSYQLWFYKSFYINYFCNDIVSLWDNIKNLDIYIKRKFSNIYSISEKNIFETNFDFTSKEIIWYYINKNIDTVIVCPPYYNLEHYDNSSWLQSWEKSYDEYLNDMKTMINNWIKITNKYFILIIANYWKYKLFDIFLNYIKNCFSKLWKIKEIVLTNKKANINNFESLNDKYNWWEFCIIFEKE